jgi:hypothetical protein
MSRLTIEWLSSLQPNISEYQDAAVLCLDGVMVSGQVRTNLAYGIDAVPEFTVTLQVLPNRVNGVETNLVKHGTTKQH